MIKLSTKVYSLQFTAEKIVAVAPFNLRPLTFDFYSQREVIR